MPNETGATAGGRGPTRPPVVRRILMPTDLSQWAETAVDYAIDLAAQLSAELRLFAVIDSSVTVTLIGASAQRPQTPASREQRGFQQKLVEDARRILQQDVDRAAERGVRAMGHVKVSEDAEREILTEARVAGADMIVVMAPERQSLAEWLIGSTAEEIMRRAPCNVLIVRSHPRARA